MKVLDLQCCAGHVFEGWFASESDFLAQQGRSQVVCPFCGDIEVVKRPSAPRLSLGSSVTPRSGDLAARVPDSDVTRALQVAWLAVARQILAKTEDVGGDFAQEARKIYYGESPGRAIRGLATAQQTTALIEEGIEVLPFGMPEVLKKTLQ